MIGEVTQEDIDNGHPRQSWACPIANATGRLLGYPVFADGYGIRARSEWPGSRDYKYKLSQSALRRMRRYDAGKGMQPFRFRLLSVEA